MVEKPCRWGTKMYRKPTGQISLLEDFRFFAGGKLDANNRWVKMADLIPWDVVEDRYASHFPKHTGNVAKPVRVALGALIIKEKCGFSDEETVQQIMENPYLQYFIGLEEFQTTPPFDSSSMVHFRKRLDAKVIAELNEALCKGKTKTETQDDKDQNTPPPSSGCTDDNRREDKASSEQPPQQNHGKLILDATCTPADVKYPTDFSLLNDAREKLEAMVDTLHENQIGKELKPRTYRQKARKLYLKLEKNRKPRSREIRKAIRKQLSFVARDLQIVLRLSAKYPEGLSKRQQKDLETIQILFEQQKTMYDQRVHTIEERIVSISQPHVRPIVRGKKTAATEFGAKVAISIVNGYAWIEKLSWEAFNEGTSLVESVETYKKRHGNYPESVIADKIYRNRDNLQYCKLHGIRLNGPKLGRPSKDKKEHLEQRRLEKQEAGLRNAVEAKFGEGKRCYGLGRIMARLKETSETVIGLQFIIMNLGKRLRDLLYLFWETAFFEWEILFIA